MAKEESENFHGHLFISKEIRFIISKTSKIFTSKSSAFKILPSNSDC